MKITLTAFFIITSGLFAQEITSKTSPISGDDIVRILELRAQKEVISFSKPKYVTLRFESDGQKKDFAVEGPTSSVTLLTYIPSEGGPAKPLYFWITNDSGRTISSYFSIDTSKTEFSKRGLIEGVYTIVASDSKDMKAPTYRLQVLPSDEKPQNRIEAK